jgi:uncharacterized membrane protein
MTATNDMRHGDGEGLARAVGWLSVGLGVAALAAPRRVGRMIGVGDAAECRDAILAVGLREVATGIGMLARPRSSGWIWARLGGDAMDLALLGGALASGRADPGRVSAAAAAVLAVAALDLHCGRRLGASEAGTGRPGARPDGSVRVRRAVFVNRPRDEIYAFWRDLANLPRIMGHLDAVETLDDGRSRWRARGPAGMTVAWEAEVMLDEPGEMIAWRSLPGGDVDAAGVVRFERAPGGRGTAVEVEFRYMPPGGRPGTMPARLFGRDPDQEVLRDLRAFKQAMEAGAGARIGGVRPAGPQER